MTERKAVCVSFPMGCYRSMVDAALLVDYFKENRWRVTSLLAEADMILIGGCGLDLKSESMSNEFLSIALKKKKSTTPVFAFGCYSGIRDNPFAIRNGITLLPRTRLHLLDRLIEAETPIGNISDPNDLGSYTDYLKSSFSKYHWARAKLKSINIGTLETIYSSIVYRTNKHSPGSPNYADIFDIRIANGCLGKCSYCLIRFEAGPFVSKPMDDVMKEFRSGISRGYKVLRLNSEDVGAYGQDVQLDIAALMEEIFNLKGDFKLVIDDFSPRWFLKYKERLLDIIVANQSRLGYLCLPIQSGSEGILTRMNRDYSAAAIRDALLELNEACPHLPVKTHFMVGFPGESDDDFQASIDLARSVPFANILVFKYSDRPGTVSSNLTGRISEETKNRRRWALIRAAGLGRTYPV